MMRIIAGEARGRTIEAPSGRNTRPTLDRVRENIFNMIQQYIPDSSVLDLFAGSGALGFEALSRGASFAVLNDIDRNACAVQKKNTELLRFSEKTRVIHSDWQKTVKQLQQEQKVFDLVFLDPPYIMTDLRNLFLALIPLTNSDTLIILEHEARKNPDVPEQFSVIKCREWGFCAVRIFRYTREGV